MCKSQKLSLAWSVCILFLALLVSCRQGGPPAPLPLDQLPTALNQAFSKARPELKELAERAGASVQNHEPAKALLVVEGLCATPDLTPSQREVATRAMVALTQELNAAQARGDKEAAELLRARQHSR